VQNGLAFSSATALNMRDNHHASDGQLILTALPTGQTGREAARPATNDSSPDGSSATAEAEATPAKEAEAVLPVQGVLLTDILPMDFSALETSIRAFFDQVEALGSNLTEHPVDLLFTTCILVATTAVALEVARRQMKPAKPALVFGRESIPYSDCI
jgi:hypothetical protein